ncbi:hypothetical protein OSTOST_04578, partial [Ostertagia ostertagi]
LFLLLSEYSILGSAANKESVLNLNQLLCKIPDVIKKLRELSITSPFPHIRTQCREVLCDFIGNHPSSDDPQTHIEWFIAQLDYELEDGRLSAVDMLNGLFSRLEPVVLNGACLFIVSKDGNIVVQRGELQMSPIHLSSTKQIVVFGQRISSLRCVFSML